MYARRILDDELDELLPSLAAIAIEGPKGVGKTATAMQRASTVLRLDDPTDRALLDADPGRLERDRPPILLDEWQRMPRSWDLVRRSVDARPTGGRFLLTGSATPSDASTHSGAGRIVRLRMRPLALAERDLPDRPTVSLRRLLTGERPMIDGTAATDVERYTDEIVASGFPGIRGLPARARRLQLDGYLARVLDTDFAELGHVVRRPVTLQAWLRAYAAATSTTTSYTTVLDAATPGDAEKPAKTTTIAYRDVLTRLWLLEPVPAWHPGLGEIARLAQGPKHHLADPALAARLVGVTGPDLLRNSPNRLPLAARGPLLGALFESLVTLSVRTYAQAAEATVHHLRTQNGDHEIDLIVEGPDRRVVAVEVKLGTVDDHDVAHLHWLAKRLGDRMAEAVVITSGSRAYRRQDGIAVVPASLLGP